MFYQELPYGRIAVKVATCELTEDNTTELYFFEEYKER
jgi:hypothetical protein